LAATKIPSGSGRSQAEGEELMESASTFSLWRDFLDDGGLAVVSPYVKYKWGVSPRDVIALFLAVRPILLHNPKRDIDIRSWEYFSSRSDWMHNLLVISSEVANQMAEFMRGEHLSLVTDFSFKIRKNCLIDTLREEKSNCLIPVFEGEPRVHNTKVDYALITRACNPFAPDKKIVILAGIKGYGTIAAALAFSEQQYWNEIDQRVDTVLGRLQLDEDEVQNALVEIIVRAETPETPRKRDLAWDTTPYIPRWPTKISVELVRVNADRCTEWVHKERPLLAWSQAEKTRSPGGGSVIPPIIWPLCPLAAMAIVVWILVLAAKQVPDQQFAIIAVLAVIVLIVILVFVMRCIGVIDEETLKELIGLITRPLGRQ
jgi:hypothetical protein